MNGYIIIYFVIGAVISLLTYFICWNNFDYELAYKSRNEKILTLICIIVCWPITVIVVLYDQYMYRSQK